MLLKTVDARKPLLCLIKLPDRIFAAKHQVQNEILNG